MADLPDLMKKLAKSNLDPDTLGKVGFNLAKAAAGEKVAEHLSNMGKGTCAAAAAGVGMASNAFQAFQTGVSTAANTVEVGKVFQNVIKPGAAPAASSVLNSVVEKGGALLPLVGPAANMFLTHKKDQETKRQLNELGNEIKANNERLAAVENTQSEMGNEIGDINKGQTEANNEIAALKSKNDEMGKQVEDISKGQTEANNEIAALKSKNDEMGKDINKGQTEANNEIAALKSKNDEMGNQIGGIKRKIDEMERQISKKDEPKEGQVPTPTKHTQKQKDMFKALKESNKLTEPENLHKEVPHGTKQTHLLSQIRKLCGVCDEDKTCRTIHLSAASLWTVEMQNIFVFLLDKKKDGKYDIKDAKEDPEFKALWESAKLVVDKAEWEHHKLEFQRQWKLDNMSAKISIKEALIRSGIADKLHNWFIDCEKCGAMPFDITFDLTEHMKQHVYFQMHDLLPLSELKLEVQWMKEKWELPKLTFQKIWKFDDVSEEGWLFRADVVENLVQWFDASEQLGPVPQNIAFELIEHMEQHTSKSGPSFVELEESYKDDGIIFSTRLECLKLYMMGVDSDDDDDDE